jgi:hypothetical protein
MSRSQRELSLYRHLLAIAVYRLGGEMKVTPEDMRAHWELGLDHFARPTVVTGFKVNPPENPKK